MLRQESNLDPCQVGESKHRPVLGIPRRPGTSLGAGIADWIGHQMNPRDGSVHFQSLSQDLAAGDDWRKLRARLLRGPNGQKNGCSARGEIVSGKTLSWSS